MNSSYLQQAKDAFLEQAQGHLSRESEQSEPWLQAYQKQSLQQFRSVGFPHSRMEDWRYINLRPIFKNEFDWPGSNAGELSPEQVRELALPDLDTTRIVLVNGLLAPELSNIESDSEAPFVMGLSQALGRRPSPVRDLIGALVPADSHGFVSLNGSGFRDGVFIDVAAGQVIERPVEILSISTARQAAGLSYPRILVRLSSAARLSLIERQMSLGDHKALTASVAEIYLADGAQLEHYRIQEENYESFSLNSSYVQQQADSRYQAATITLGGHTVRNEIHAQLQQNGSRCDLAGLYLGRGRQYIENFIRVNHLAPDCYSDEFFKGVMDDRSKAVFQGRITVAEDAQHTDAQQQNKNLLLSPHSEVNTKPQLEIYADDVKCSHGATVGQLDEEALFYLQTRGIGYQQARQLLTYAFANDLLTRIEIEPLRAYVEGRLLSRLS